MTVRVRRVPQRITEAGRQRKAGTRRQLHNIPSGYGNQCPEKFVFRVTVRLEIMRYDL